MGNKVYYSAKELFEARAQEVAKAKETGEPIFTPETYGAHIMVDYDMQQKLTSNGLVHKGTFEKGVGLRDEATPVEFHATYNSIYRKMADANKDEIFVFLATADPERLKDESTQMALFSRLAEIHKEDTVQAIINHQNQTELLENTAAEVGSIEGFLETMDKAVKVEDSYYTSDFVPDDAQ